MTVMREEESRDATVGAAFEGDASGAAAGIEKPIDEFRQQLGLIAKTSATEKLVSLAE
jgi:hypothetical protein